MKVADAQMKQVMSGSMSMEERCKEGWMHTWLPLMLLLIGGCAGQQPTPSKAPPSSLFSPSAASGADIVAARGLCPITHVTPGEGRLRLTLGGDVLFDTDKSELKPAALEALERIKQSIVDARPGSRLEIEGHTDDRASASHNLALSERRAGSVAKWFASTGVGSDRLSERGYGEEYPRVRNTNDANRAKNRRVEVVVSWGPPTSAVAKRACPGVQACCDARLEKGCLGATLGPEGWGADLGSRGLEDVHGVLRLDPCRATRSAAVWITSTDENKVSRLDERDGKEVFRVDTYGAYPQRTAVAADGSVWITNRDSGSYVHLGPDGKLLCSSPFDTCTTRAAAVDSRGFGWIGCFNTGALIQVDPAATDGTTRVTNSNDEQVEVPRCKEVARVEVSEVSPYGLAADRQGGLWIGINGGQTAKVDAVARRVIRVVDVASDPALVPYDQCWGPYGITIDRDGNPWFANMACQYVVKLDGGTGAVLGVFTGGPDGMSAPRALGSDQRGHIWVSQNHSHFVDELRPDGSFVKRVSTLQGCARSSPLGVASDSEGDLWVALPDQGQVLKFRPDGTHLGCYPDSGPLFQNPYTYSDFTGAAMAMAGDEMGKTRVRLEHPKATRWRMLSFRSTTPPGAAVCVRARAAASKQALDQATWSSAHCPRSDKLAAQSMALGEAGGLQGRVLEVEIELSTSDPAAPPLITDLTAAAVGSG
jgi:outer membrane protein OmpA-like peptidoglycan-associated protein/streptogramin lyase